MDWMLLVALVPILGALVIWATGRWGSVSTWVTNHKEPLTVLAILTGGIFAGSQYLASKDDARKKETIAYVEHTLSFEDPVGAAQLKMVRVTLTDAAKCELLKAATTYNDKGDITPLNAFIANKDLESDILVLTRFYRSLTICVEKGVCDSGVACDQFATDIRELKENFHGFFMDYKDRWGHDLIEEPYKFSRTCTKRTPSQAKPTDCAAVAARAASAAAAAPSAGRGATAASSPVDGTKPRRPAR